MTSVPELQKLLEDERSRTKLHRDNFEQLKEENRRLQEDCIKADDEIKKTVEESTIVQEKYKWMYEEAYRKVMEQKAQLEEMNSKILTPTRLEILRAQVTEEVHRTFIEKFQKQEQEVDNYRTLCNKTKQELAFVKSQFEREMIQSQRILEEVKLRSEAEITNLRKEKETAIVRVKEEYAHDTDRLRIVEKEKTQLLMKLKSLTSELEEVKSNSSKIKFESDNVTRVQGKRLEEYSTIIKSIQFENESLRRQVDELQRDIADTGTTHNRLNSRIHELERENVTLKNKMEEMAHASKVDLTQQKMKMIQERGDIDREKDKLKNVVEDLQNRLKISKQIIENRNKSLKEKEQEAIRRVQAATEEGFYKIAQVEEEKIGLETKLHEMGKRLLEQEERVNVETQKYEEQLISAKDSKDFAERELLLLKTKIDYQESLDGQLDRERFENSELKSKIARLESEITLYQGTEHSMTDENLRLRNQIELLKDEAQLVACQLKKFQDNHTIILESQRSTFNDEKIQLGKTLREFQDEISETQRKYQSAIDTHKKYQDRCVIIVSKLKRKLEITEAEKEKIELENKALQKSMSCNNRSNKSQKRYRDLQRRHRDLRRLLSSSTHVVPFVDDGILNLETPLSTDIPVHNVGFMDQEMKQQEELRSLKERLNRLDHSQQQQLKELQKLDPQTYNEKSDMGDIDTERLLKEKRDRIFVNYQVERKDTVTAG